MQTSEKTILCARSLWSLRFVRVSSAIVCVLVGLSTISTITTGWQYLSDVLAGGILAVAAIMTTRACMPRLLFRSRHAARRWRMFQKPGRVASSAAFFGNLAQSKGNLLRLFRTPSYRSPSPNPRIFPQRRTSCGSHMRFGGTPTSTGNRSPMFTVPSCPSPQAREQQTCMRRAIHRRACDPPWPEPRPCHPRTKQRWPVLWSGEAGDSGSSCAPGRRLGEYANAAAGRHRDCYDFRRPGRGLQSPCATDHERNTGDRRQ